MAPLKAGVPTDQVGMSDSEPGGGRPPAPPGGTPKGIQLVVRFGGRHDDFRAMSEQLPSVYRQSYISSASPQLMPTDLG